MIPTPDGKRNIKLYGYITGYGPEPITFTKEEIEKNLVLSIVPDLRQSLHDDFRTRDFDNFALDEIEDFDNLSDEEMDALFDAVHSSPYFDDDLNFDDIENIQLDPYYDDNACTQFNGYDYTLTIAFDFTDVVKEANAALEEEIEK